MNSMAVPIQPDTAALARSLVDRVATPAGAACRLSVIVCSVARELMCHVAAWMRSPVAAGRGIGQCWCGGFRFRSVRRAAPGAARRRTWSGPSARRGRRRRPRAAVPRPASAGRGVPASSGASAAAAGSACRMLPAGVPGRVAFTQPARASSSTGVLAPRRAQLPQRAEPALGDLQRSVGPDLAQQVARIAGLLNRPTRSSMYSPSSSPTSGRVGATSAPKRADQPLAPLGCSTSATVGSRRPPQVGHRRVRTVEQAQLHQLVGRDVGDEQRPVELPRRPGRDERVLAAPTAGTARRRPPSRRARRARRLRRPGPRQWWPGRSGRRPCPGSATDVAEPVEHRVPVRPRRCLRRSRGRRRRSAAPLRGHVVAGHDADRRPARPEARGQRGRQPPDDRDQVSGSAESPWRRDRRRPPGAAVSSPPVSARR